MLSRLSLLLLCLAAMSLTCQGAGVEVGTGVAPTVQPVSEPAKLAAEECPEVADAPLKVTPAAQQPIQPVQQRQSIAAITPTKSHAISQPVQVQQQPQLSFPQQAKKQHGQMAAAPIAAGGCPAIAYTHKVDCGEEKCKLSFVNLSPMKPLDWVDVHLVKSDSSKLNSFLSSSSSSLPTLSQLATPEQPQINLQMILGAGVESNMHDMAMGSMPMAPRDKASAESIKELKSEQHKIKFGVESAPEIVLQQSGGSQVWQVEVPLTFKDQDLLGVSFTYCQQGTDCDTELSFYQLRDDKSIRPSGLASSLDQKLHQPIIQPSPQLAGRGKVYQNPIAQMQMQHSNVLQRQPVNIGQAMPLQHSNVNVQQMNQFEFEQMQEQENMHEL